MKFGVSKESPRGMHGVTLIELLIALAIVAILATIAVVSYDSVVLKTRRSDAKVAVNEAAQRLERCLTQFAAYDAAGCVVAASYTSPEGFYAVSVARDASTYLITAVHRGPQIKDETCKTFTLNHLGLKGSATSSDAPSDDCW